MAWEICGGLPKNPFRDFWHDPRSRRTPRLQGEALAHNLEVVARVGAFAAARGWTPTQLAAADIRFSPEDLASLDRMFAPGAITGDRYAPQVLRMWHV